MFRAIYFRVIVKYRLRLPGIMNYAAHHVIGDQRRAYKICAFKNRYQTVNILELTLDSNDLDRICL